MNVIYDNQYNIKLGLLKYLHPFDGAKFKRIYDSLKDNRHLNFSRPPEATSMEVIDHFLSSMMRKKVRDPVFVLRALEVPRIPFLGFSFLNRKILTPMRWGVAGTLYGAEQALRHGGDYWNLSGGYHHAFQQNMEGFCIYNDIGICYQQMVEKGLLAPDDKVLIIDTDAHHGNGNAYAFMENKQVAILDVYNTGIYPTSGYTRERVDIPVPLPPGTGGEVYLQRYREALKKLDDDYRLAFVVAGTDVLASDKLGGLCLSTEDVAERERLTLKELRKRSVPTVLVGGGGYSKDSAKSVIQAITKCAEVSN